MRSRVTFHSILLIFVCIIFVQNPCKATNPAKVATEKCRQDCIDTFLCTVHCASLERDCENIKTLPDGRICTQATLRSANYRDAMLRELFLQSIDTTLEWDQEKSLLRVYFRQRKRTNVDKSGTDVIFVGRKFVVQRRRLLDGVYDTWKWLDEATFENGLLLAVHRVAPGAASSVELGATYEYRLSTGSENPYTLMQASNSAHITLPFFSKDIRAAIKLEKGFQLGRGQFLLCWTDVKLLEYNVQLFKGQTGKVLETKTGGPCYIFTELEPGTDYRATINAPTAVCSNCDVFKIVIQDDITSSQRGTLIFANQTHVMQMVNVSDLSQAVPPQELFSRNDPDNITAISTGGVDEIYIGTQAGHVLKFSASIGTANTLYRSTQPSKIKVLKLRADWLNNRLYVLRRNLQTDVNSVHVCTLTACPAAMGNDKMGVKGEFLDEGYSLVDLVVDSWNGYLYLLYQHQTETQSRLSRMPLMSQEKGASVQQSLDFSAVEVLHDLEGTYTSITIDIHKQRLWLFQKGGVTNFLPLFDARGKIVKIDIQFFDGEILASTANGGGLWFIEDSTRCYSYSQCIARPVCFERRDKPVCNQPGGIEGLRPAHVFDEQYFIYIGGNQTRPQENYVDLAWFGRPTAPAEPGTPESVMFLAGASTAILHWKPPKLLPFQAQNNWRYLSYEYTVTSGNDVIRGTVDNQLSSVKIPNIRKGVNYAAKVRSCFRAPQDPAKALFPSGKESICSDWTLPVQSEATDFDAELLLLFWHSDKHKIQRVNLAGEIRLASFALDGQYPEFAFNESSCGVILHQWSSVFWCEGDEVHTASLYRGTFARRRLFSTGFKIEHMALDNIANVLFVANTYVVYAYATTGAVLLNGEPIFPYPVDEKCLPAPNQHQEKQPQQQPKCTNDPIVAISSAPLENRLHLWLKQENSGFDSANLWVADVNRVERAVPVEFSLDKMPEMKQTLYTSDGPKNQATYVFLTHSGNVGVVRKSKMSNKIVYMDLENVNSLLGFDEGQPNGEPFLDISDITADGTSHYTFSWNSARLLVATSYACKIKIRSATTSTINVDYTVKSNVNFVSIAASNFPHPRNDVIQVSVRCALDARVEQLYGEKQLKLPGLPAPKPTNLTAFVFLDPLAEIKNFENKINGSTGKVGDFYGVQFLWLSNVDEIWHGAKPFQYSLSCRTSGGRNVNHYNIRLADFDRNVPSVITAELPEFFAKDGPNLKCFVASTTNLDNSVTTKEITVDFKTATNPVIRFVTVSQNDSKILVHYPSAFGIRQSPAHFSIENNHRLFRRKRSAGDRRNGPVPVVASMDFGTLIIDHDKISVLPYDSKKLPYDIPYSGDYGSRMAKWGNAASDWVSKSLFAFVDKGDTTVSLDRMHLNQTAILHWATLYGSVHPPPANIHVLQADPFTSQLYYISADDQALRNVSLLDTNIHMDTNTKDNSKSDKNFNSGASGAGLPIKVEMPCPKNGFDSNILALGYSETDNFEVDTYLIVADKFRMYKVWPSDGNCQVLFEYKNVLEITENSMPTSIAITSDFTLAISLTDGSIFHLNFLNGPDNLEVDYSTKGVYAKNLIALGYHLRKFPDLECLRLPTRPDAPRLTALGAGNRNSVKVYVPPPKEGGALFGNWNGAKCDKILRPPTLYNYYIYNGGIPEQTGNLLVTDSSYDNPWILERPLLQIGKKYSIDVTWSNHYNLGTLPDKSAPSLWVGGTGYPTEPKSVKIHNLTPGSVLIEWYEPDDLALNGIYAKSQIVYQVVQQSNPQLAQTDAALLRLLLSSYSNVVCTDEGFCWTAVVALEPDTEYTFQVKCGIDVLGADAQSASTLVQTKTLPNPGTLELLQVHKHGIDILWVPVVNRSPPRVAVGEGAAGGKQGGVIIERLVNVTYSPTLLPTKKSRLAKPLDLHQKANFSIENLRPATEYTVTLNFRYKTDGTPGNVGHLGYEYGLEIRASTEASAPWPPETVKLEPKSSNVDSTSGDERRIWVLTWQPPMADGGSPVLQYVIERRRMSSDEPWKRYDTIPAQLKSSGQENQPQNSADYSIEIIEMDDTFEYRVAAENAMGLGEWKMAVLYADGSSTGWLIVLLAFLAILLIGIAAAAVYCFMMRDRDEKKKRNKKPLRSSIKSRAQRDMIGIVPTPGGQMPNLSGAAAWHRNLGMENENFDGTNPEAGGVDLVAENEINDLPHIHRSCISISRQLGQGAFGEVFEGLAYNLPSETSGKSVKVAVKTLRDGANVQDRIKFFKEAIMMRNFHHANIVALLGVCLDEPPQWLVLELMDGGDLLQFLRASRPSPPMPSQLSLRDLSQMSTDVCNGCAYLEQQKHVHRDLAARNCLVANGRDSANRVVKIADFGLARDIYEVDYYRVDGSGLLPIRWMAPESLIDGVFTTKTDVWAFGVLLWEMYTLGEQPYQGRTNWDVLNYVRLGGRLPPTGQSANTCELPTVVYDVMLQCWQFRPGDRPDFSGLADRLRRMLATEELQSDSPYPPLCQIAPAQGPSCSTSNADMRYCRTPVNEHTMGGANKYNRPFTTSQSAKTFARGQNGTYSLRATNEKGVDSDNAGTSKRFKGRRSFSFKSLRKQRAAKVQPPRPPSKEELQLSEESRFRASSRNSLSTTTDQQTDYEITTPSENKRPLSHTSGDRITIPVPRTDTRMSSNAESYTTNAQDYEAPLIKGVTNKKLADSFYPGATEMGSTNFGFFPESPSGEKSPNTSSTANYVRRPKKPAPKPPYMKTSGATPGIQETDLDTLNVSDLPEQRHSAAKPSFV